MATASDQLLGEMRKEMEALFGAAVRRVDPYEAVRRFVRLDGDRLVLGQGDPPDAVMDLKAFRRIFLVGGGKATAPMARAMENLCGDRIERGIITVKYGFTDQLAATEIVEAGHPLPDRNGVEGTKRILALLEGAEETDLVFSLISGGGSALLPQPCRPVTLEEKQALTKDLLACGATIDEMNAIRKHISSAKGGQMARAAAPATTVNLMLSDVVGDKTDVIASGPFVPDMSTYDEAWGVLEKYGLKDIPASIRAHLKQGMQGEVPETPKPGESVFDRVHNYIIGSNILALDAAEKAAREMGYETLVLSSMIEGETREIAGVHTAIAREIIKTERPVRPPVCIISGGETTVTLKGSGLGGRNMEFCLAAALGLNGLPPRVAVLSGGTDGNDGPTPAAGAVVDPLTVKRAADMGLEASAYLNANDSYHFFEKTGELLMTGPTKTNVMDVRFVLVR